MQISTDELAGIIKYLSYNPETGILSAKLARHKVDRGQPLGSVNSEGYLLTSLNGRIYPVHKLCWLLHTGSLPNGQIDHEDSIRVNNKWENLRDVSQGTNLKNKSMYANNASGITGVSYRKSHDRWVAQIRVCGKGIHLGSFKTKDEAIVARATAAIKYGFHANHGIK